ncbi:MAG: hypothetical protein QXI64_09725 [Sulfolobales archaeon]
MRGVPDILMRILEGSSQSIWVATAFLDSCGSELLVRACKRDVSLRPWFLTKSLQIPSRGS